MNVLRVLIVVVALGCLAGCSTLPGGRENGDLARKAVAATYLPPPAPTVTPTSPASAVAAPAEPTIKRGNGVFVRSLPPRAGSSSAESSQVGNEPGGRKGVQFNFQNQPVQAVVKAVLGDYLKRTYAIKPGVKGTITFSTAHPVAPTQALPILETLLSWTGNALIEKDGRFLVLPAKNAVAGNLVPGLRARPPGQGMSARLFPLQYISADAMKKLLKPFAPTSAFLLVDSMRNLLVMAGTPEQLANYARTIKTFDVDWLKGMSVGVFTLKHASVTQLMPQLERLFGPKGSTPLSGMLRFIPIKRTNAIVVITPQPDYLDEVHQWINRIDAGGGNRPQLYVYDVKNVRASMLAGYINQIYNGAGGTNVATPGGVAPGLTPSTLTSGASALKTQGRSADGSVTAPVATGNDLSGAVGRGVDANGGGSTMTSGGVRVTAIDANNQLLVRCRPSQWAEIESAIKRLDVVPLQVQIETRILEVQLTGKFSLGVQWYLQGLAGGHVDDSGEFVPGNPNNPRQLALGAGGAMFHPVGDSFFYRFANSNLEAAIHAIETSSNTTVLSEPSLVVMNNRTANIQVGEQIPVNQTFFAPGLGSSLGDRGIATLGSVQYKDTGVILKVRPRVNPGGLVYLNLVQVVSKPGATDAYGNFPIQKRELATQIAVQSGQTVLLGGLIQQNEEKSKSGVPWLSRIPILGRLFGSTKHQSGRTELLILITPRIITSSAEARAVTLDYERGFQSLAPLHKKRADKAAGGTKEKP